MAAEPPCKKAKVAEASLTVAVHAAEDKEHLIDGEGFQNWVDQVDVILKAAKKDLIRVTNEFGDVQKLGHHVPVNVTRWDKTRADGAAGGNY